MTYLEYIQKELSFLPFYFFLVLLKEFFFPTAGAGFWGLLSIYGGVAVIGTLVFAAIRYIRDH